MFYLWVKLLNFLNQLKAWTPTYWKKINKFSFWKVRIFNVWAQRPTGCQLYKECRTSIVETGYSNTELGGRNMSWPCRKSRRGDVQKKNGHIQHTLTERFFSCNNLIKAQYTCLFVSSLICQVQTSETSITHFNLWSKYEQEWLVKNQKVALCVIAGLNCHNKYQFSW